MDCSYKVYGKLLVSHVYDKVYISFFFIILPDKMSFKVKPGLPKISTVIDLDHSQLKFI